MIPSGYLGAVGFLSVLAAPVLRFVFDGEEFHYQVLGSGYCAALLCRKCAFQHSLFSIRRMMARQTGFCGDGCSFDSVDIDCSMAFRMVESTIRRIMGGLIERRENEDGFAGLVEPDHEVSAMVDSQHQHRPSKYLSSIPPHSNLHCSPPTVFSYPSSAPLLPQIKSILQGLEDLTLQGSPKAVSTPLAGGRTREGKFHLSTSASSSPTPPPTRKLSSTDLPQFIASAALYQSDQARPDIGFRAKGELHQSTILPPLRAKRTMIDLDLSKHFLLSLGPSTFLLEETNNIFASEARNCKN